MLFGISLAQGQEPFINMPSSTNSSDAPATLCSLVIGLLLGVCGQIARSAVGLKKEMDKASKTGKKWGDWFVMPELLVSLLLGGAAGVLAAVAMMGTTIDSRFILGCMAAGYAGSDFIQGFMSRYLPEESKTEANPATPLPQKPTETNPKH